MSFWYRSGACSNNERIGRQGNLSLRYGVSALALLCAATVMVRAQDIPPGFLATFDITQRLEYSDNVDFDDDADAESDLFGRTVLGFGLESVTKVQRFALNLGVDITEGRNDRSSVDIDNPFVRLAYDRNVRNATLGVDLNYSESDVDGDIDDLVFDENGNIITQSGGTRQFLSFGLDGAVGRDAPIGASWSYQYSELTFSGTNDPDLTDQNTHAFSGQVDFRISPKVTTSLVGRYSDFDAQGNGVNRETTSLGVATDLQISSIFSANVGISYDRIERSGDETDTDEGISLNAGLTRALPDGSWGVSFATDVTSNDDGRRSRLIVDRQRELPTGNLNYSFGLTGADVVGTDPLFGLDYLHALPGGQISVGLSQDVVTDDDNDERINTRLRAAYDKRINAGSSVGVSVALFDVNDLSAASDDSQRIDLSLTYRYDLTRDWGLVGTFTHARIREDNDDNRSRNTVFVGLQRSFNWSP